MIHDPEFCLDLCRFSPFSKSYIIFFNLIFVCSFTINPSRGFHKINIFESNFHFATLVLYRTFWIGVPSISSI